MSLVFVIEDEPIMAEVIAMAVEGIGIDSPDDGDPNLSVRIFNDAVSAMDGVSEEVPDLILLDVFLTGPDGFAFLNEMLSYDDTMHVPVILISTLDLADRDLSHYGVVGILDKTAMKPEDIRSVVLQTLAAPRPVSASPVVESEGQTQPAIAEAIVEAPVTASGIAALPGETLSPDTSQSPDPVPAEVKAVAPATTETPAEAPVSSAPTSISELQAKLRALEKDA